ncbi:MAG: TlpA family protein disulfide reductase [Acidimicrobiales bacterium]
MVIAVALITIVSVLTGSRETSNGSTPRSALVGKQITTFNLGGLNGGTQEAPWVHNRASVLIFFASWCTPCQGEIPKIAKYLSSHSTGAVEVLGIDANDKRSAAQAFVKKDGVTFPVAFDANGAVTSGDFGFITLPETVFLNSRGIVTGVHIGAIATTQLARGIRSLQSS